MSLPLPRTRDLGRPALPVETGPVVACVDGSAYVESVCDHAAWFAGRIHGLIELLHVEEPAAAVAEPQARDKGLLERAAERLAHEGAGPFQLADRPGRFVDVACQAAGAAGVLVIGRRGSQSAGGPRRIGGNVEAIVRAAPGPVCVVPKLFLPISRVSIVEDPASRDRAFADRIATSPYLDGLQVSMAAASAEGVLRTTQSLSSGLPDSIGAARRGRPVDGAGCDLVVLPRSAVTAPQQNPVRRAARRLLRSRLPVLVY
jgi:nucleotide-binding universal stress UspA family protein